MSRMSACKGVPDVAMCQRCERAATAAEKTETGEECPMFVEVRS